MRASERQQKRRREHEMVVSSGRCRSSPEVRGRQLFDDLPDV